MKFEEKLYELRKEKGYSQEQLADLLNISRQAVSKWEGGSAYPETEKLIQISDLFGVSVDYLVRENVTARENDKTVVTTSDNTAVMQELAEIKSTIKRRNAGGAGMLVEYEYKSKRTFFGLPLVHINHKLCGAGVAKGIIAIGDIAFGVISFGGIAVGGLSLGGLSLGLLLSLGGLSFGGIALGGIAIGIAAAGGLAVGIYALGGCAIGAELAVGGFASARVAVGSAANGQFALQGIDDIETKEVIAFIKAHL